MPVSDDQMPSVVLHPISILSQHGSFLNPTSASFWLEEVEC